MNDTVAVAETTQASTKKWYIVQTTTNHEKKVLNSLTAKIAESGLSDVFGRVLVPEESVIEVVEGKSKRTTRKFYPGYVFIEMDFNEAAWHLISSTSSVIKFIGGVATRPAPISKKEMDIILERMRTAEETPVHKKEFTIGQTVLITNGAFKDFEGAVEEINYNQNKLRVMVSIFGRPTPVELEFSSVEKIT